MALTEEMCSLAMRALLELESRPAVNTSEYFELTHIMDIIHAHIDIAGSQRILSDNIQVKQSYVSNILNGIREPSKKVLDAIGYEAVTVYRKTLDKGQADNK